MLFESKSSFKNLLSYLVKATATYKIGTACPYYSICYIDFLTSFNYPYFFIYFIIHYLFFYVLSKFTFFNY